MDGIALEEFDGAPYATEAGDVYLDLKRYDSIRFIRSEDGWAFGVNRSGQQGWFPLTYWTSQAALAAIIDYPVVLRQQLPEKTSELGALEEQLVASTESQHMLRLEVQERDAVLDARIGAEADLHIEIADKNVQISHLEERLAEQHSLSIELKDREAQFTKLSEQYAEVQNRLALASHEIEDQLGRLLAANKHTSTEKRELDVVRSELFQSEVAHHEHAQSVTKENQAKARTSSSSDVRASFCLYDWQYELKKDQWLAMPPPANEQLSRAYLEYRQGADSSVELESGSWTYRFDFGIMEQVNVHTNASRAIRWNFNMPSHWLQADAELMEMQLRALPMKSPASADGIPGAFQVGQTVYVVGMVDGHESDSHGTVASAGTQAGYVRVSFEHTTGDVPAVALSLVGPRLPCGYRVGQVIYVFRFRRRPLQAVVVAEIEAGSIEVRIGTDLHFVVADETSPFNPGYGAAVEQTYRRGQDVFSHYTVLSGGYMFPPGVRFKVCRTQNRPGHVLLHASDVNFSTRPISIASDDLHTSFGAAPPEVEADDGLARGEEVVHWTSSGGKDTVRRGVVQGPAADGKLLVDFATRVDACCVSCLSASVFNRPPTILVPVTAPAEVNSIESLLKACVYHHTNDGWHAWESACDRLKAQVQVSKVWHVENVPLWRSYQSYCRRFEDQVRLDGVTLCPIKPSLPPELRRFSESRSVNGSINEGMLFHGTVSFTKAWQICRSGFDHRLSKEGLYGHGTYFTPQFCKSNQYTEEHRRILIMARVPMGEPHYATSVLTDIRRPPRSSTGSGRLCDSVIACPGPMQGHHREFQTHHEIVIFEKQQAYPEYIVEYCLDGVEAL
mmetsp:Transcript_73287/g.203252  ORF Transcript_73287/g.203252 Transcript_73287/m.203252 type:complete len:845 (-) Transcript_73287:168-2702(-)